MEKILSGFYKRYHRKYDSDKKLREHIGTIQIPKFSVLIQDILENAYIDNLIVESITNKEVVIREFPKKIAKLVNSISSVDSVLDNGEKHKREFVLIPHIRRFMENFQNTLEYIENLGVRVDTSLLLLDVNNLFNLLEKELILKKGNRRFYDKGEILDFLKLTNSDFFLYIDLTLQLIKQEKRAYIASFFEYYSMMDILLDDMADIEDDLESNSYNPLHILLDKEVYYMNSFCDIATDYGKNAVEIANKQLGHLSGYLAYLAEAELEALNIFKYNINDICMNTKLKKLVLKPYPWEIYEYDIQN